MKKLFAVLALIAIVAMMFAGCSATGKCEICGNEGKVTQVEYMGESAKLCDSCKALFDIGVGAIESGAVDLEDFM